MRSAGLTWTRCVTCAPERPAGWATAACAATPGALILDSKLAAAVSRLSHLPSLVIADGRPLAWTPYRYAVYLHWMNQTAQAA
jgi:hypothetical protein